MSNEVNVFSFIPENLRLNAIITNYNCVHLRNSSGQNGETTNKVFIYINGDNTVSIQDPITSTYLTVNNSGDFRWTLGNNTNEYQKFKIVKSSETNYPYAILNQKTGEYIGTDIVGFFKMKVFRTTKNLGAWESFDIKIVP